ncbi:hypothetical protein INS49_013118 [Diaporthe citri]|uniref:uncharacterized protein n=1 Tax=Diaporthe citri TaxID=83186 RepID=UPI001C7EA5B6|nr:uncharacterized protein INS49_013118 [Diaporthe citri]KAG6359596.1 hypothetical protein INS49_013118 [Diaporthe citri]
MRFASGEKDNYEDDHYATLGVKPSDSIETIRKAGNALRMATHSDHNKGIDNDKFIKVNAAIRILGDQVKKAKYDLRWWARQPAAQANSATQQREADALRRAAVARDLARRREEVKRAVEAAKAAEAKKKDEERKARRRAKREAQRAEAERQKKAEEEKREEDQRRAAIEAAKAVERKKGEQEAARKKAEAAAAMRAAANARAAERERVRKREARMVVLRHVPIRASLLDVTQALEPLGPGRILDSGVGEGTAWFEFWTAEQAQALQRIVTETDQCVVLGKTIKTASIYQGRAKPPEGPELITRSLYIIAPPQFLDGEAKLYPVLKRKLRAQGFTVQPAAGIAQGDTPTGKWLIGNYASVAKAQSAKAALEKHYPELKVYYSWDLCEGVVPTAQEGAEMGSNSSKKGSDSWVSPVGLVFGAVVLAIAIYMDINKLKSSDKEAQQKNEDK